MAPPPGTKRMTANPKRPARYRPGKAVAESESSEEEDSDAGVEIDEDHATTTPASTRPAPPKATSFPADGAQRIPQKHKQDLKHVDLAARRKAAELQERMRVERERRGREAAEREAGFVTESEEESEDDGEEELELSEDEKKIDDVHRMGDDSRKPARPTVRQRGSSSSGGGSGSDSEESDDSDDSASESDSDSSVDQKPKLLRPVFIPKSQRGATSTADASSMNHTAAATATAPAISTSKPSSQARTDAFVQAALERAAAERAAAQKAWDDDEPDAAQDPTAQIDDTDGLDPELERAQWEARELGRMKRARAVIEEREAQLAEAERRRALAPEERAREDEEYIAAQRAEQEGKGKAGYMARYHHRGAFFREEAEREGLMDRDLMGARFEDESRAGKAVLPEYLQVRDATKIGKKGRTRYRDLRSEDTGRWGDLGSRRDQRSHAGAAGGGERDRRGGGGGADWVEDERFRPDYDGPTRGSDGPTGANASAVRDRKRGGDGDGERHVRDDADVKRVKRDQVV